MVYGIFFHAQSVGGFWLSSAIHEASGFFRMATFFFVSAFLTAMIFERKGVFDTLRTRCLALGVPLVVSYLTLVPLAKWGQFSIARMPDGGPANLANIFSKMITFELSGAYLHLWFLIVLLVYLVTAPVALALFRFEICERRIHAMSRKIPRPAQVAVLASIVGAGCALSMSVMVAVLPERAHSSTLVNECFFNYPFYLMGLAAYAFRDKFTSLFRIDRVALAAATLCVLSLFWMPDAMPHQARWFLEGAVNTVAALGLTALFARYFSRPGPRLAFLSRSVYSVYLVHFTFIFLFGYLFAELGAEDAALYCLVVLCSVPASIAFHVMVVEPTAALRFLFNGRITSPRQVVTTPATEGRLGL